MCSHIRPSPPHPNRPSCFAGSGVPPRQDDEIGRNIMLLANKRPDIFASTAEEVSLAVQKEIDASKLAPEPTPPGPPPLLNSSGTSGLKPLGQATGSASNARSLEEQIAAIHKAKETGALGGAVRAPPQQGPSLDRRKCRVNPESLRESGTQLMLHGDDLNKWLKMEQVVRSRQPTSQSARAQRLTFWA